MFIYILPILFLISLLPSTFSNCSQKVLINGRERCMVQCGYGNKVCECDRSSEECMFTLNIERLTTFTSYRIIGESNRILGISGVSYYINSTGNENPLTIGECSNYLDNSTSQCTEPNWVDGKNYRSIIAINGIIPGPTLIVDENATVIINVHNRLLSNGISIHWHGLRQFNTPWMDGVGMVTQCNIAAFTSFQYTYLAQPSGTFWYHSHSGTQRSDGLFGALVIRESLQRITEINLDLTENYGISGYFDNPDVHTLTLTDWYREEGDVVYHNDNSEIGFFPEIPLGQVPISLNNAFEDTRTFDNSDISPVPFYSGLINGLGRHESKSYIETRLSIFTVKLGNIYRFRLIGSMALLPYRFSISGHKLIVAATDGFWIEPIREVDYIIIHSGERYDFLLNATGPIGDYFMEANSMEINITGSPPFETLGHVAEGILHYSTGINDNGVLSSKYEEIKRESPRLDCNSVTPCRAVNCPFQYFLASYHTQCINVDNFRLLEETPGKELPSSTVAEENVFFLNFNFAGESGSSTINGRNYIFPPVPPVVQRTLFKQQSEICNNSISCDPFNITKCLCTHVLTLPYNKSIQLVISSIQPDDYILHPLHIHGHTFQVLKIGYPTYSDTNGFVQSNSRDIICVGSSCSSTRFNDQMTFIVSNKTVRKDTIVIPGGGYVVVSFISDNPGAWFLHCHIMNHELEGMTLIIDEAPDYQNPPPSGLQQCQNFQFNIEEFYDKLSFNPSSASTPNVIYSILITNIGLFTIVCLYFSF